MSDSILKLGSKVYPIWDQTGIPFEVIEISADVVLVSDDYGNQNEIAKEDIVITS